MANTDEIIISIDDGDMFEGTFLHFEDCFFSFPDYFTEEDKLSQIEDWCAENNYRLKVTRNESCLSEQS